MEKLNCTPEQKWRLTGPLFNASVAPYIYTDALTAEFTYPERPCFQAMLMVGMVFTMTIAIIGTVGNLLGLATIIHQFRMPRRMRHVKKVTANIIFIMNLCLADFCYSCTSLPNMFINYKHLYRNYVDDHLQNQLTPAAISHSTCEWAAFLRYGNAITEWTTLGLMALERCVTIYRFQRKMHPSKWFSACRAFYYCILIWILAIALQTPTLFKKFGCFGYNESTLKCDFMPTICNCTQQTGILTPRLFFFTIEIAVPFFLILIGYIIILNQVYNKKGILAWNNSLTTQAQINMALRRSKTTRLIVLLLTVFMVCIIPVCVFNVAVPECELSTNRNQNIGIAVYCVYWIQYALNIFIYVFSNAKYRLAYKQLLCFLSGRVVEAPPKLLKYELKGKKSVISTINGDKPRLRIRTPSETVMDEENNNYKKNSSSCFNGIKYDEEIYIELPILLFPKTRSHKELKESPKKISAFIKTIQGIKKNNAFAMKSFSKRQSLSVKAFRKKKPNHLKRYKSLSELNKKEFRREMVVLAKSLSLGSHSKPKNNYLARSMSL